MRAEDVFVENLRFSYHHSFGELVAEDVVVKSVMCKSWNKKHSRWKNRVCHLKQKFSIKKKEVLKRKTFGNSFFETGVFISN